MLVHEMLEETAKRYPQNIAVKHEDRSITFEELNKQSTKLATFFDSKGVKEGDRIAIVAEKSIQSVTSIFGILKSGAMYVPIDPSIPIERLEYILKDCDVDIVIPCQHIIEEISECFTENILVLLTKEFGCTGISTIILDKGNLDKLDIEISKDASAYIMYTSGSTGEPKGIEIYHTSVTNLMEWYCQEFNITPEDKILSFVPFWFDASICDLFSMAKAGATLVLPPEGINMFPNEFAKFLVDEQIRLFFAPSSQFVLALDALKELKYPHLKTVMFGAEELPIKYVREMKEVFKDSELVNIYGPTECTDVATFYRVPKQLPKDMEEVPIGVPYPSILTTLVNEEDNSCDIDEVGELLVYGPNIMKGYWNKQKETNKTFVCYSVFSSGYWYRTGDLVYQDKNGDYVYVGRKDRQIKSMGRRIQLEEIEHVLNEHPLITEAVVVATQNRDILFRVNIDSHVVSSLSESEIIAHCRNKLPEYMIPDKINICESLPKTGTGKLNRRELE